jgi:uncharacterized integral membrane protein (TIGR00697 family)
LSRTYKYYDLILGGFVAVLLCSNLIGPGKTVAVTVPFFDTRLAFGCGNLFFPVSYIFGDVLTEVYGYARSRRAIWAGFGAMLFATLMAAVVVNVPPDPAEPFNHSFQPALELVFGNTWRIARGSLPAGGGGDFCNTYVLARLKLLTGGKMLWVRTIGSTLAGQLVDSAIFYPIAFAGIWVTDTLIKIVIFNWVFKVVLEAVFTPLTYVVVRALKKAEQEDYYDRATNFTPFSLSNE